MAARSKIETDPHLREKAVELARRGHSIRNIARVIGIHHQTLARHRDSIPGFNDAFKDALDARIDELGASALETVEAAIASELTNEPITLRNPQVIIATLRALSLRFAQSRKQVDNKVSLAEALDALDEPEHEAEG